jgi:hypothetical protein
MQSRYIGQHANAAFVGRRGAPLLLYNDGVGSA